MRRYIKDTETGEKILINGVDDIEEILAKYDNKEFIEGKRDAYATTFGTFDIETTSLEDRGFMYIWQFCIGQDVIMGRTWEEYLELINAIVEYFGTNRYRKRKIFVCYVHSLPFEFQFIKDFHRWEKIFALEERVPITARTVDGIEFRCSYKLSNMSLAKFCEASEGCTHYKKDGEKYNYKKIRTKDTHMTNNELLYCYCDVKGLHEALESRLVTDNLATIPMTSTGYVRRKARKAMQENPRNWELLQDTRLDEFLYVFLRTGRRGGDTHANAIYAKEILHNVDSWDITSSYPYVMMCKEFPVTPFVEFTPSMYHKQNGRAIIMEVEFKNIHIKSIHHIPYIPVAKAQLKEGWRLDDGTFINWTNDNGRIMNAHKVRMILTDIDMKIINDVYDFDECKIIRGFSAEYGLLPIEFRKVIAEYFQLKSDLKNGDQYYYGKIKNEINALFGMMLTDMCHPVVTYRGKWDTDTGDVSKMLDKYYNSRNSFLPYQWGIWVTAHARYRLHEPMQYSNMHKYGIYTDTDSWKLKSGYDRSVFDTINRQVMTDAENYDIKPYAFDDKGNKIYLGVWDYEGTLPDFVTLGAKKYAYTDKDGELHVTVSGLSKKGGAYYLNCKDGIETFKVGTIFPARYKGKSVSGRTVSVYYPKEGSGVFTDTCNGVSFTSASSIAIHDTTYTLGVAKDYDSLLKRIEKNGYKYLT